LANKNTKRWIVWLSTTVTTGSLLLLLSVSQLKAQDVFSRETDQQQTQRPGDVFATQTQREYPNALSAASDVCHILKAWENGLFNYQELSPNNEQRLNHALLKISDDPTYAHCRQHFDEAIELTKQAADIYAQLEQQRRSGTLHQPESGDLLKRGNRILKQAMAATDEGCRCFKQPPPTNPGPQEFRPIDFRSPGPTAPTVKFSPPVTPPLAQSSGKPSKSSSSEVRKQAKSDDYPIPWTVRKKWKTSGCEIGGKVTYWLRSKTDVQHALSKKFDDFLKAGGCPPPGLTFTENGAWAEQKTLAFLASVGYLTTDNSNRTIRITETNPLSEDKSAIPDLLMEDQSLGRQVFGEVKITEGPVFLEFPYGFTQNQIKYYPRIVKNDFYLHVFKVDRYDYEFVNTMTPPVPVVFFKIRYQHASID
jgi:hypothetical protein